MPELPDVEVYLSALAQRVRGARLEALRIGQPFLLRTVDPKPAELVGKSVRELRRVGKRIALGFDDDLWLVIHLMIAGRLHWTPPDKKPARRPLFELRFATGTLTLTEAGSKRRASLHVLRGPDALASVDPGGIEPLETDVAGFARALRSANHTLKRSLTDPRLISGIGNAYSDEILHRAKLSPIAMTSKLGDAEIERLLDATRAVLREWVERLRAQAGAGFPEGVTAFRPEMAVHGRYRKPCPVCGSPVQRIVYAENETNYCATCQTGGRLLADRALSRLLKSDWPRTLEEMEALRSR
ncbi:MAG TPA: DNA-formamidopyrimidine glycosylase family protein [Myxococcota bacterium]|nr:DNA-formamidopyrimidine glycosylase family protein [Myxococcota bacterium]